MLARLPMILAVLISSIFWVNSPVSAKTDDCKTKILQSDEVAQHKFDHVKDLAEVEHEGINYHWIELYLPNRKPNDIGYSSVYSIDKEGSCKLVFLDFPKPLPTLEDYHRVMGKEVTNKFLQIFLQQN